MKECVHIQAGVQCELKECSPIGKLDPQVRCRGCPRPVEEEGMLCERCTQEEIDNMAGDAEKGKGKRGRSKTGGAKGKGAGKRWKAKVVAMEEHGEGLEEPEWRRRRRT